MSKKIPTDDLGRNIILKNNKLFVNQNRSKIIFFLHNAIKSEKVIIKNPKTGGELPWKNRKNHWSKQKRRKNLKKEIN